MTHPTAQLMEQAWSSFEEVAAQLGPDDWNLPTDCPEWTVRDQLAHISSIEAAALGRPPAPGDPVQAPHVRNDLGATNQREIEYRRSWTPEEVLDEYRDTTAERGKVLASWSDEEWESEGKGVLGVMPRAQIISIRIVDVFTHEQDVRVATGHAGHLNGEVARFVYGRMAAGMPFAFAKRAQATDGQSVVFEVSSPGTTFGIEMQGKRAVEVDLSAEPTVRLAMDFEAFLRLSTGRWSPNRMREEGRVRVSGDADLAERMLTGMNIML
ncbi:MAG: maleylpyruvate isomerase family mycothiol-dependent enzyme [Actinomycetota bacterium]